MPDPDLQRPQGPPPRVAALRKDQDHAAAFQDLVAGAQPRLVQLASMWRNWKDADQGQQAALPGAVEDGLPFRHRVDHRRLRKERDDEGGVEPGLMVGRDYVRRR